MTDSGVIASSIDRAAHEVLVVDDNPATRYSTSRILHAAGFRTREACSGAAALAASSDRVSAVVLDVHLPDMNGFEVCRQLRANPDTRTLPVVHLSAEFTRNEDRVAGLDAGADAYLVHPVEPAVLVATLQALIRARVAEEGLRQSESRLRAIFDNLPVGVAVLDAEGRMLDANPALAELLACDRGRLMGSALASRVPAEWRDTARLQMTAHTPGRESWSGCFPLLRDDGARVLVDWNMSGSIDPGLRIAIAADASEREQMDTRRRALLAGEQAARAAAERHSRTKDDFIAVLSHELRTPLHAITGWVAILARRQPTPEVRKGLDAIERSVKAQARIISDILDMSRINSGKLTLERVDTDPADLVVAALESLRQSLDEKHIRLNLEVDTGQDTAWLDPDRYQQILWNLMTNAIKFSRNDSTVDVTLRRQGDQLRLKVRDYGAGIAPEFLGRLFDRFAQAQAPGSRVHGGLGLGLSIVRQLAELHGGTVHAESAGEGEGTTLSVTIPVGSPPAGQRSGARPHATAQPEGDDRPLEGLRVLVVEDDHDAIEMLIVVLADRGARVRVARDFDSGVRAAQEEWPDVLLSDIGLPQRDGYELVMELRRIQRLGARAHLPAVALTAFSRTEDHARALEAGFDRHLAKPLNPHALVLAIRDAVQAASGEAH